MKMHNDDIKQRKRFVCNKCKVPRIYRIRAFRSYTNTTEALEALVIALNIDRLKFFSLTLNDPIVLKTNT